MKDFANLFILPMPCRKFFVKIIANRRTTGVNRIAGSKLADGTYGANKFPKWISQGFFIKSGINLEDFIYGPAIDVVEISDNTSEAEALRK